MAERLNIIMPCSRRWNLPRLFWYYEREMLSHTMEVRWLIGFAGPEPDFCGINKYNECLGMVNRGWVFMTSDDSMHDVSLFRSFQNTILSNPDCGAVVFGQKRGIDGGVIFRACPENMKVCQVDLNQVFLKRDFLGSDRLDDESPREQVDGRLFVRLWKKDPGKFVFVGEHLTAWNNLRP